MGDAGPGEGKRAEQREQMQDFAESLKERLPETGMTLASAVLYLNSLNNFQEAAEAYRLPRQARIVSFFGVSTPIFLNCKVQAQA